MITQTVTSVHNPKIKQLLALQQKSSERRESGIFVVEGKREIMHCLEAGFKVETAFVCPELLGEELPVLGDFTTVQVTKEVYARISYRESTEGIIAEVRSRQLSLEDIPDRKDPLLIVLERVEKPGNLGAVLRSADACGADAVIVCDPLTDIYNPNLIRASIGAVFTVPTVACTSGEAISWLKKKGISILTAQLQDSALYYDTDMTKGTAIVMGTESTGLTETWRKAADAHIRIPMLGRLDSLNVSVSAAILLFEAVRQRQEKK